MSASFGASTTVTTPVPTSWLLSAWSSTFTRTVPDSPATRIGDWPARTKSPRLAIPRSAVASSGAGHDVPFGVYRLTVFFFADGSAARFTGTLLVRCTSPFQDAAAAGTSGNCRRANVTGRLSTAATARDQECDIGDLSSGWVGESVDWCVSSRSGERRSPAPKARTSTDRPRGLVRSPADRRCTGRR